MTLESKAYNEIVQNLLDIVEPDQSQVKTEIRRICAKYSLTKIPRNIDLLKVANGSKFNKLRRVLIKKPTKTSSGVAIVALMPKPFACPHGRCTFCPGGIESNSPNSYTGKEPATQSAISYKYDPALQIKAKLDSLVAFGHEPSKTELVIVGGTFLFMPRDYQIDFVRSCYDALNGMISDTLESAKSNNEHADIRNVGFTIETKPDYCKQKHVDWMLEYGVTRVEIGVQTLQERVYNIINRGHNYNDIIESFQISKDAGYKIVAHMMPGLPTMTPEQDIADFKQLYRDPDLLPDMLKIYPSLVIKGTPLYDEYLANRYHPYSDETMIDILTKVKRDIPKWVRIMRVQREISPDEIIAGPKSGNLRQLALLKLKQQSSSCRCIRCREIGLDSSLEIPKMTRIDYKSSDGDEVFLSFEDSSEKIYGFLRLRRPSNMAHRPEIKDSCIVRELHVYGRSLKIGEHCIDGVQHLGLGKQLLSAAEKIAAEEFDAKKILVISAVGTRQYYYKNGYSLYGPYMAKELI